MNRYLKVEQYFSENISTVFFKYLTDTIVTSQILLKESFLTALQQVKSSDHNSSHSKLVKSKDLIRNIAQILLKLKIF